MATWLDVGKPISTVPRKAMASLSTRAFCGGSATLMLYNNEVRGHGDVTDVVQYLIQKYPQLLYPKSLQNAVQGFQIFPDTAPIS